MHADIIRPCVAPESSAEWCRQLKGKQILVAQAKAASHRQALSQAGQGCAGWETSGRDTAAGSDCRQQVVDVGQSATLELPAELHLRRLASQLQWEPEDSTSTVAKIVDDTGAHLLDSLSVQVDMDDIVIKQEIDC